jgi:hypothetical protein
VFSITIVEKYSFKESTKKKAMQKGGEPNIKNSANRKISKFVTISYSPNKIKR